MNCCTLHLLKKQVIIIGKKEVRNFLSKNATKQFSQEDLSRELKQPVSAVSIALSDMKKEGTVLISSVEGRKGTKHKVNLYSYNEPDPLIKEVIDDYRRLRKVYSVLGDLSLEAVLTVMLIAELRNRRNGK